MDREPRKQLQGITARRRRGGAGGAPECGGFSRVPRIHTVRVRIYVFLLSPPAPTTFLPERYYLSRSLQPPFSENKHQYVILSSGYLLSHRLHRLHRFSFVLRTPNLTTTYTTYTTSNGDIVAKGRVVLVVIVVHVVVNSKFVVVNSMFLSLTLSVSIRCYRKICAICVTKKLSPGHRGWVTVILKQLLNKNH